MNDSLSSSKDDISLFGPETHELPTELPDVVIGSQHICLPMMPDSRSLNLSNTVAAVIHKA